MMSTMRPSAMMLPRQMSVPRMGRPFTSQSFMQEQPSANAFPAMAMPPMSDPAMQQALQQVLQQAAPGNTAAPAPEKPPIPAPLQKILGVFAPPDADAATQMQVLASLLPAFEDAARQYMQKRSFGERDDTASATSSRGSDADAASMLASADNDVEVQERKWGD